MSNFLLQNTNRCKLIKDVSEEIWNDIISLHSTGQESSEIYYTKKLVSKILAHSKKLNYSIWAREPGLEKVYGCDIDIFIEKNVNDFTLFAFQAKVLKLGDYYADLDKTTKSTYQYQKLEDYGKSKQCHANYLFYNGVSNFTYRGSNKCSVQFDEKQFGLSYASINSIKSVISSKANWTFQYFHPKIASPLSELVCCKNTNISMVKSYDYNEIVQSLTNFQQLVYQEDINKYFEKILVEESEKKEDLDMDKNSNRNPEIVIIIRNTASTF